MLDKLKAFIYHTKWYAKYDRYKTCKLRSEMKREGLKSVCTFNWKNHKTSDTIFILGSGYSIMSYSKSDWEYIGKHNSFGLNGWIFEDFTPTYYGIEPMAADNVFAWYKRALISKKNEYKNTPIFVQYQHLKMRGKSFLHKDLPHDNIYYNAPYMPNTTNPEVLKKMIDKWAKLSHKDFCEVFHYAGSLSYAIGMSYVMGYKNIVLLGVDLKDLRYYYQHPKASNLAKEFRAFQESRPRKMQRNITQTHNTNSKKVTSSFGCLPISVYMDFTKDAIAMKGVKLFIGSKDSALYPMLDLFEFPKK